MRNKYVVCAILAVLALGLFAPHAGAGESDWSYEQNQMGHYPDSDFDSWSPVKAVIPPDVRVTPPASTVSAEMARLSAVWGGWYCPQRNTDLKIVFETVSQTEASVLLSFGWKSGQTSVEVRVHPIGGSEFAGDYPAKDPSAGPTSKVLFRLRQVDGLDVLDIKRTRLVAGGGFAAGSFCWGILKKISSH